MEPATDARADGVRLTRATLRSWNQRPGPILLAWTARSLIAAAVLLVAVLAVALLDPGTGQSFLQRPPFRVGHLSDVRLILSRNVLVLAFHGLACVAGYLAGSALPAESRGRSGWSRVVHRRAGQGAIVFVVAATIVSLGVQAVTIGGEAANVASALAVSPAALLLALLPHAVPELTVLFLPLAAWVMASRRGDWDELLAATAVTVAVALPVLLVCACWEVYVAPHVVAAVLGRA